MNKSNSFLKALSTSAIIFLGWETFAVAENIPKLGEYHRSQDFLMADFPTVPRDRQKEGMGYKTIPIQISQSTEPEQQIELTNIESLEPNANPLTFPTKPEEVKTNINAPITLEQAIELALRNNKALQVAKLELKQSEQALRAARAALYPTVDAQLELTNQDENQQIGTNIEEELTSNLTGNVELSYSVYSGGEISARIRSAEKRLRLDELDVERITEETRFEATRDYYELQNFDAQVEIAQAAIEDASQTLRDAQLLEQAGLGTRFDVLRAEVELANEQQNLNRAIARRKTAQRTLAQTLSVGQKVELTTADDITEAGVWSLPLEETIILAYRNRAELEQEIVSRELNEQERQIQLSEIRPRVSLFANYIYNVDDIFDENLNFEDENQYRFGARLNWRLFDGGAARANADRVETSIEIDETQFAQQRNQVRLDVEEAYFGLQANQENIGTSQKAVELAEESLRLARLRFQAGVGTQTDVIEAQSDLTTARGNFLSAVIDYNLSLNQLQRAVTNLPDGKLFDLP